MTTHLTDFTNQLGGRYHHRCLSHCHPLCNGSKGKKFSILKKHNANKANIVHIYSAHWYMMNGALAFAATTIPPPHNANHANIVHIYSAHWYMKTGGGRPPHHTRVRMVHPLWYRVLLPLLCVCVRLRTARARIHTAAALPAATTTTAAYDTVHVCKCLCGQPASQPASRTYLHAHKYHYTCCPVYVCGCACIIRGGAL